MRELRVRNRHGANRPIFAATNHLCEPADTSHTTADRHTRGIRTYGDTGVPVTEPSPTATPTPSRTLTHTPSPLPTATATPTAREAAAEGIAEIIQGPRSTYADLVGLLVDLWLLDTELGATVAEQPWLIAQKQADDGNRSRSGDRRILETLHSIASADVESARLLVSFPWFVDGLTYFEGCRSAR